VAGHSGYLDMKSSIAVHNGLSSVDGASGIFVNRSNYSTSQLLDGGSNTLMFGEALFAYIPATGNHMRSAVWMGMGGLVTRTGLSNKGEWYMFSSRHHGIVQFCLADGSVRPFRVQVNTNILNSLGGIRDDSSAPLD
jgi:hypothetical protein